MSSFDRTFLCCESCGGVTYLSRGFKNGDRCPQACKGFLVEYVRQARVPALASPPQEDA
jgi:hypothetical protein